MPAATIAKFRAEGFQDEDPLELDGSEILAVLRGTNGGRKSTLLPALALLRRLLAARNHLGPPLGGAAFPVAIDPALFNCEGPGPIVLAATVDVDIANAARKPATLRLDQLAVTARLTWSPSPMCTLVQFSTPDGRDFAKQERTGLERDLDLAADLVVHATESLLRAAREPRARPPGALDGGPLSDGERRVLDAVAEFVFTSGDPIRADDLLLSLPDDLIDAAEAHVRVLIERAYIEHGPSGVQLAPSGLIVCTRAEEAIGFAERLLEFLKHRATMDPRFTHFTRGELAVGNVADTDEYAILRAVIRILRLEGTQRGPWGLHGGPAWARPDDMLQLKRVTGIVRLCERAEALRQQEAAQTAQQAAAYRAAFFPADSAAPRGSTVATASRAQPSVDLGIVVALKEEVAELLELAGAYAPSAEGGMNSYLFSYASYRCVVTLVGPMGESEAARVTERQIAIFDPAAVVAIGISGAVHGDLRVGDTYVPEQAVQYMQNAKAKPTDEGGFYVAPGAPAVQPDHDLYTKASGFDLNNPPLYRGWRAACREDLEALLPDPALRAQLFKEKLVRREVALLAQGHEASGPVVSAAAAFSAWIQTFDRNVKAIDMETAAVLRTARSRPTPKPAIAIRGISDFGDDRKPALDAMGEGGLRRYAMRNAVRFLWSLLDAATLPRSRTSAPSPR